MKFVRAIPGYNHLWAVRDEAKEADEFTALPRMEQCQLSVGLLSCQYR